VLKRKVYDRLLEWKEQNRTKKKALCIIGARQVGKTTLIREFGRLNYENFAEINFVTDENAAKIFSGSLDANMIITNLTAYVRRPLEPGKTLVLIDEVQQCPDVRTAIKFLVEDGRFDYIESGSLLGVKHNEVKSYPVGFEEIYRMYPMDFEEFLWANGVQQSTIDYLQQCFIDKSPVSQSIHDTMNRLFYSYIVVGGMPQVVATYADTHDIGKVISDQRDILEQYRLDIAQYADGADKIKIKAIFDSIPAQLNDKNRRFHVNSLNKNARLTRYDNSFKWLDDAGVALPCYNVNEPRPPLKLNEKHNLFKLYMSDTGLLCAACMDNIQLDILNGRLEINMGSILENLIAQQLKTGGFYLNYFDSGKHGEIDFLVQNGMRVDLIEVKSGGDYRRHRALDNILSVKEWNFGNAYVLCQGNIETGGGVTYLPWYLSMFLHPIELPKNLIYEIDITGLRV